MSFLNFPYAYIPPDLRPGERTIERRSIFGDVQLQDVQLWRPQYLIHHWTFPWLKVTRFPALVHDLLSQPTTFTIRREGPATVIYFGLHRIRLGNEPEDEI